MRTSWTLFASIRWNLKATSEKRNFLQKLSNCICINFLPYHFLPYHADTIFYQDMQAGLDDLLGKATPVACDSPNINSFKQRIASSWL